jgi:hypothetical protein
VPQLCCAFAFLLGGWSLCSTVLYTGPYGAFGRAALGEKPTTRDALRAGANACIATFLAFVPQSIGVIALYAAGMAILIAGVFSGQRLEPNPAVLVPGGIALALVALAWIWAILRWFYLAPLVAICEGVGFREAVRRSGELSKGRLLFLAILRFTPDGISLATMPQLNGLRLDQNLGLGFGGAVQVIAPIAGFVAATYVGALLTAVAYAVTSGRAPRDEESDA